MRYLVIENQGEIEENAFALMGASTKRGSDTAIGMFGTGSKYALAVLLENGISPVVLSGDQKIKFSLQDATLKGATYRQVVMQSGRKVTPLSFTTSMGLHWGIAQALRELVSNAIDEGGFTVDIRTGVIAKDGATRLLVPFEHDEVRAFYRNLRTWFVWDREVDEHVDCGWRGKARVFERCGTGVRVYRRGVLVFSDPAMEAAFDYDLDWLKVREDRTADKWEVLSEIPYVLDKLSAERKARVLDSVIQHNDKSLEGLSTVQYSLGSTEWADAALNKHLATAALVSAHPGELAANPKVVVLPDNWVAALTKDGVGCSKATDLLTTAALKGYAETEPEEADPQHAQIFEHCLALLEQAGVFDPQNAPVFRIFETPQNDAPWGEYVKKEDKVLVNIVVFSMGKRQVFETILEELMHRKTGYSDNTRQFQTAIFRELTSVFCRLTGVSL